MAKGSFVTKTPLIYGGCVGWMDGKDTSIITSSGGSVSRIENKADPQNPFTQPTGLNQPTTQATTIAGNNVITFDGSNDYLLCNSLSSAFTGSDTPFSAFAVYRPATTAGQQAVFCAGNSGTALRQVMHDYGTGSAFRIFKRDDATTQAIATTSLSPVSTPVMMSMSCAGTTLKAWKDGTSFYNGAFDIGVTTLNTFTLGCRAAAALNNFFSGDIAEIIIYNRGLSDVEVDIIENYLGNKWGIAIS